MAKEKARTKGIFDESVSPKTARRYLRTINDESKFFRARDGRVLRNLWDLYAFLRSSDDESFRHHVDGTRNDYANWVRDVIMDEDLASYMDCCLARTAMANRLLGRINFLVSVSSSKLAGPGKASVILEEAKAPEELFIASDGRVIRNLWELLDFVKSAKEDSFKHHVNELRNDIATWVEEIVLDDDLSRRIRDAANRAEMHKLIESRLKELEKKVIDERKKNPSYHIRSVSMVKSI